MMYCNMVSYKFIDHQLSVFWVLLLQDCRDLLLFVVYRFVHKIHVNLRLLVNNLCNDLSPSYKVSTFVKYFLKIKKN